MRNNCWACFRSKLLSYFQRFLLTKTLKQLKDSRCWDWWRLAGSVLSAYPRTATSNGGWVRYTLCKPPTVWSFPLSFQPLIQWPFWPSFKRSASIKIFISSSLESRYSTVRMAMMQLTCSFIILLFSRISLRPTTAWFLAWLLDESPEIIDVINKTRYNLLYNKGLRCEYEYRTKSTNLLSCSAEKCCRSIIFE